MPRSVFVNAIREGKKIGGYTQGEELLVHLVTHIHFFQNGKLVKEGVGKTSVSVSTSPC